MVQKEYSFIKKITSAKAARERETAALRYKLMQHRLLEERDNYISRIIDKTLRGDDRAVLFIGAYHQVQTKLPADIRVIQVKELAKIRQYHTLLTNLSTKTREQFRELAKYVAAPVVMAEIV